MYNFYYSPGKLHILKVSDSLISGKKRKKAIKIQNGHQYSCQLYDFGID